MSEFAERLEPRRFFDAGEIDTTFGTSDHRDLTVENAEFNIAPVDIDAGANGQIYVTAATILPTDLENEAGATYLWRLRADGTPDTSFGLAGTGLVELPGAGYGMEMGTAVTPDGGVLVRINSFLYKLKQNGTRDKAFGRNGRINLGSPVHDYAVDSAGKIYFATGTFEGTTIRRYNADGSLDTSYGTGGVFTPPGGIRGQRLRMKILNDGSIVVAGKALPSGTDSGDNVAVFDAVIIKLKPDGTLDTSFNDDGVFVRQYFNTPTSRPVGSSPVITADGALLFGLEMRGATNGDPVTRTVEVIEINPSSTPSLAGITNLGDAIDDGDQFLILHVGKLDFFDVADPAAAEQRADDAIGEEYTPALLAYQSDGSILMLSGKTTPPPSQGGIPVSFSTVAVHRLLRDDSPVAQPTARTLTQERNASYRFKVTYRDDDDIDASSIGNDDVTVRLPDGTRRRARLVNVALPASDGSVTATYLVTSPDGTWSFEDNGEYSIRLERRSVRDTSGNAAAQRQIGTYVVQIPSPVPVVPPAGSVWLPVTDAKDLDELME